MTAERDDTIEVGQLIGALRRGWRWVVAGTVAGLLAAVLALALLEPRYEGTTTVLVRGSSEMPGLGGSVGAAGRAALSLGGLGGMLSLDGVLETEKEILTSRSIAAAVADSLGLQARITQPRPIPLDSVFSATRFSHQGRTVSYEFRRAESGEYLVEGPGVRLRTEPGGVVALPAGTITLRPWPLPESFELEVSGRAQTLDGIQRASSVALPGGEIMELAYEASDPWLAAAVPNVMVREYLRRRRTLDRGVNTERYEFLDRHADSLSGELAGAEGRLREHQERSGLLIPQAQGEAEFQNLIALRASLEELDVESRALEELVEQQARGGISARQLAGYPNLLRNEAIGSLLARLYDLETERNLLLSRRTPSDPDVLPLDRSIEEVEAQIGSLARSYLDGIRRQAAEIRQELGTYRGRLAGIPAQAETSYRLEREVKRLSETLIALQTHLVQARLGAISEGGTVRTIDAAEVPTEREFPKAGILLPLGLMLGLLGGGASALLSFYGGRNIRDETDVLLIVDLPVVPVDRSGFLVVRPEAGRGVLVLPAGAGVDTAAVAHAMASTAALQGRRSVVAELGSDGGAGDMHDDASVTLAETGTELIVNPARGGGDYLVLPSGNGAGLPALRNRLDELATENSAVIVALPQLDAPVSQALLSIGWPTVLVVRRGMTTRTELREATSLFRGLGIPVLGVILQGDDPSV